MKNYKLNYGDATTFIVEFGGVKFAQHSYSRAVNMAYELVNASVDSYANRARVYIAVKSIDTPNPSFCEYERLCDVENAEDTPYFYAFVTSPVEEETEEVYRMQKDAIYSALTYTQYLDANQSKIAASFIR